MPFTFKLSRRLARIRRWAFHAAAALVAGAALSAKTVGSPPIGHLVLVPENLALDLARPQPVAMWVDSPAAATCPLMPTTPHDRSVL
jgi:hypothetical protein